MPTTMKLGKLEEIKDLREIWPNEAQDFTPWLSEDDNMAILADAVGIDITAEETESAVGDFSVDILASETGTDRKVIIENQMGDTDHDHLGKLITYASGKGADVVIWVVKHAREEHKAAIEWLNSRTDEGVGFFLCEVKVVKIGASDPAVKFEVIERPNDWAKGIRKNEALTELQARRREYWEKFQDYAFSNPEFQKNFNRRAAGIEHWMDYAINSSACNIALQQVHKRNVLNVGIYIPEDKNLFRSLLGNRDAIEDAAGLKFDWRELPERKASRIVVEKAADLGNRDEWTGQFDWLIDTMLRIKKAFKKYI